MSTNLSAGRVQSTYEFIKAQRATYSVQALCRVLDVGGRTLHVHPPEDILLQKLRWYRKGGEVSDRQWRGVDS